MKALVVYYSQTGNTEEMAKNIAQGVKERDVQIEVVPIERSKEKSYSTNVEEAKKRVKAEIEPTQTDLSNYNLLLIGTPVWSSAPATPVNGYLARCKGVEGVKILCFATHGGGGAGDTFKIMRERLEEKGGEVIGTAALSSGKVSAERGKKKAREIGEELVDEVSS